MGVSSLQSNWTVKEQAPAAEWMSLAEYLELCRSADLRPMIGVNYNCHNYQKCDVPRNESIARAVRQVQFVVKAGFPGALWCECPPRHSGKLAKTHKEWLGVSRYIGNEDGAPQHAELIGAHARAMKAVDPTLQAFWNDNALSPEHLTAFLKATGDVMGGAEFHGKWPFGGSPGLPPRSWQQYLAEVPLLEHKSRQSWRQKIGELRATLKTLGREDFFLANNEYGLGKGSAFAG